MAEQHVQLMKGLGLSEDQIKVVEGLTPEQMTAWAKDPTNPDNLKIFNPGDIVNGVRTSMKTALGNDAEFLKTIPEDKINPEILKKVEKGQYARFQNELVEVATKKLGLEDKELTEEDRKSIKGLAEKMATTYLTKNTKDGSLKDLQGKYQEALQSLDKLKTEHTENLTKELEKANGLHTGKLIKSLARAELKDLDGVTLNVGAQFIADPVLAAMNSKYTIILDENDNLVLRQKADPKLDVIDSAGKKVTFQQALKATVLENKLGAEVKKDDGKNGGGKKKIIVGDDNGEGGGNDNIPSYIAEKIAAAPKDAE